MTNPFDYIEQHHPRFLEELHSLLRIPSVSTLSEHSADIQAAAEWLAADMRRIGFDRAEILPTGGHPVVYGEWLQAGPDAPTILVYGHYDVQPADMHDGWSTQPFEPVIIDDYIYARGSVDDKGQVMAQLKAVEALLASPEKSPVNFKFLIEGEEEISSKNLGDFVRQHSDLLRADICVVSDTGMNEIDQPQMCYSLRGLVYTELHVWGPAHDLHSGTGHTIHNPAQALAEIIAKLHTEDGEITVGGFYDDVLPANQAERDMLNANGITEDYWLQLTGSPATWGESAYTLVERTGLRPTLEINGMVSGFYGEGSKTVIPAHAMAKISCRLVANQRGERIFQQLQDYIAQITPPTVRSELRLLSLGEGAYTDPNHPAMQAAISAYEKGWGNTPTLYRGGGSIPIVADFQKELGLPIVLLGFGVGDGAHGPNERFHLEAFRRGIKTAIHFYQGVAQSL